MTKWVYIFLFDSAELVHWEMFMKWEYISHTRGPENRMTVADLNQQGQSGWQLVSVVSDPDDHSCMIYYFKRPFHDRKKIIRFVGGGIIGMFLGWLILTIT